MNQVVISDRPTKAKLAEAYFRLGINVTETDRRLLREFLQSRCSEYATGLFRQEPSFDVRIEEGSLRGWVAAAGCIYAAVVSYGEFRTGLDYIVNDSRVFCERALVEVCKSGVQNDKILRAERRLGVPGKIRRIFSEIDALNSYGQDLPKAEYKKRLNKIRDELKKILDQTVDENEAKLISENIEQAIHAPSPGRLPFPSLPASERVALRPQEPRLISPGQDAVLRSKRKSEPRYRIDTKRSKLRIIPVDDFS
jgi:hypothetical protein